MKVKFKKIKGFQKKRKIVGTKSLVNNYLTRGQALKKLQISLKAFRRLCILKGIFPREPSKNLKGKKQATYYHTKDIGFLMHDPILNSFRQFKVFQRKLKRAKGRGEQERLALLLQNRPRYPLDHILKQRFPTFADALKEFDDALSMIFLFAQFPQTTLIKLARVEHCQRLCFEFMNYVILTRCLEKVFLSVRGIYYQVVIQGQPITWLTPYTFTQKLPKQVDYRVMLTFLDLHEHLLSFSLFKLYHDIGYSYPPILDKKKDEDCEGLSVFRLVSLNEPAAIEGEQTEVPAPAKKIPKAKAQRLPRELAKKLQEVEGNEKNHDVAAVDMENNNNEEELMNFDKRKRMFQNFNFFLDREVPRLSLEFVIRSFGGKVSLYDRNDPTITHHVVDRPIIKDKVLGRTYIQPQYVYDCANAGILLPTHEYLPGVTLPAHLSPFVDDEKEGYTPDRRVEIQKLIDKAKGFVDEYGDSLDMADFEELQQITNGAQKGEEEAEEKEAEGEEEEWGEEGEVIRRKENDDEEEEEEDKPLSKTAMKKQKQAKKAARRLSNYMQKSDKERQQQEEMELKKIMLTSKKKRMYNMIEKNINKQKTRNKILETKKERIQKRAERESQGSDALYAVEGVQEEGEVEMGSRKRKNEANQQKKSPGKKVKK